MAWYKQLEDGRYRVFVSSGSGQSKARMNRTVSTLDEVEPTIKELEVRVGAGQGRSKAAQKRRSSLKHLDDDGWVYFLRTREGMVKIGFTKDIAQRLYSFKRAAAHTGGSVWLAAVLAGKPADERLMHIRFAPYRVEGEKELFHDAGALKIYLNGLLHWRPNGTCPD